MAAFGNSDADLPMLEWMTSGRGPNMALVVHQTEGRWEWAYDRCGTLGWLEQRLEEASARGCPGSDMNGVRCRTGMKAGSAIHHPHPAQTPPHAKLSVSLRQ
jgi:hypothetical protein